MAWAKRVLVVDDEPEICEVLSGYLRAESFEPVCAGTVASAIAEINRQAPDLILLDIGLPDGSGLDVLRKSNDGHRIPTIVLTTRGGEADRIIGLEMGADDYVPKPFSAREVISRIRALFRGIEAVQTNAQSSAASAYRVGDLEVNELAHEVRVNGRVVAVRPAEFRILTILARHPGQVLSRSHLLQLLRDREIVERTLDRHINHLRHKIEADPAKPTHLITVYGVGYKLAAGE